MNVHRFLPTFALTVTLFGLAGFDAAPVSAQALLTRERVEQALARTDERIESAAFLLTTTENAQAEGELSIARDLQQQARAEFARGESRYRAAVDLTLRALARADRAIALVKGLPDPDRVLVQIERTREILDRARDQLQDCERDQARALMRVASDLQARAERAVSESRYLAALQFTLGARERVFRALRLCNREQSVIESADRALARTDEVLERARSLVSERGSEADRRQLDRAQGIQREARERYRADQAGAALRLTLQARAVGHGVVRRLTGIR